MITRDLAHAWRSLRAMPVLSLVIVVSLAVGVGVNTVAFSWIQAVVLDPIPGVDDASGFYSIEPRNEAGLYRSTSWLEYQDLRERLGTFDDLLAFRMTPLYLGRPGSVERGYGLFVSANYFSALGLRPVLGRFFQDGETATPGAPAIAVVSYEFWQTRLGGRADVIGRALRVNGQELTIVGVAPRGFIGTVLRLKFDLWLPATLTPALLNGSQELNRRGARAYSVMGRLAAGRTRQHAQGEVDAAMRDLSRVFSDTNSGITAEVLPFWQAPRGPQRFLATALGLLQVVLLLLLLTVCGNAANLMLARASARRREMALRVSLGAGRWQIVRLVLIENLLLAIAGATVGIAVAIWATSMLTVAPPTVGFPVDLSTHVNAEGLLFAAALGVVCGVVFGLAPALQLARVDPQRAFRSGQTIVGRSRFRSSLMAVQVALALVVLVAAGLFLRSFMETRDTDPGFRRQGVLLAAYDLTGRPVDDERAGRFASTLLDRLREEPAVAAAAVSSSIPLDIHGLPSRPFTIEGWTRPQPGAEQALTNTVTRGYFDVMDIPILAGTDFSPPNDKRDVPQAIVNAEFVRRYLPNLEPLGRRLSTRGRDYVIIGVVRNSLYNSFGESPTPIIYLSYRDNPTRGGEVHLRAREGNESALAPTIRRIVRDLDPELPVYNIRTMTEHVETNLLFRRVPARMFAVLGPMLLVLAAIGIYAVVAYNVSQRTTEVGIRLALGGTRTRVAAALAGESFATIVIGLLFGWLAAFAFAPMVIGQSVDPAVFLGVPVLLLCVGACACLIPAGRAANLEPTVALRE